MELIVGSDVLGADYESITLPLRPDHEGDVVATLVRRRCRERTRRAVLYIHGFHDYFFQTELADWYVDRGFTFYALDLRKYGRSIRPWHTANFCHSLAEYAEELDLAVRVIKEIDGHDTLLINAHSTGGLIAALWCHARRRGLPVDALVLNSPFLALNTAAPVRALAASRRPPGCSGSRGGPPRRASGRARSASTRAACTVITTANGISTTGGSPWTRGPSTRPGWARCCAASGSFAAASTSAARCSCCAPPRAAGHVNGTRCSTAATPC